MNYLGRRTLEDCCPLCGEKFHITKHVNEYVKFLDRNISFYQFRCGAQDHVLSDYVSLYLTPTFYRRITCTTHPDTLQLHLDFTKQTSEIVVEVNLNMHSVPVRFDYLLEDCDSLEKLLGRLEIYQAFS